MSENKSFFFDEWRDCLHSHYLYVVQTQDAITEPTLRDVLKDAGVTVEDIDTWRVEALQRAGLPVPVERVADEDTVTDEERFEATDTSATIEAEDLANTAVALAAVEPEQQVGQEEVIATQPLDVDTSQAELDMADIVGDKLPDDDPEDFVPHTPSLFDF